MSLRLLVILLLISPYSSVNELETQAKITNSYNDISVSEAYNLIDNMSSLYILDVRTKEEYALGHITYAHLIPHEEIAFRQNELPENKTQPLLVYCRSGSRSVIASNSLIDLNYTLVYNMLEGFNAWKNAGYSYESSFIDPTEDLIKLLLIITIIGISMVFFVIIVKELIKRRQIPQ